MTVETMVIVQHGYSMPGAKNYGTSKDVFTRAPCPLSQSAGRPVLKQ